MVKYNNVLKILSLPKNLKKSWDPRRLDNQEKKWKLEESDKKERKRLEELKEERQEERAIEEMRRRGEDAGVIEWVFETGSDTTLLVWSDFSTLVEKTLKAKWQHNTLYKCYISSQVGIHE